MNLRGLTLWQPVAWAVAAGHKPIENRSWKPYKGVTHVAIHAGARYHRAHQEQMEEILGLEVPPEAHLHGAILCVARLAGVVTESDSPWYSGPFGWLLEDIWPLPTPISRRGAQGLWKLNPHETAEIRRQLPQYPGNPWPTHN